MKYNDYELLDLINDNDEIAYNIMLNKYKPVIYSKALEYYNYLKNSHCEGLDLDDFLEEGIFSFNQAIKNFDDSKNATFYSFFLVCLKSSYNLFLRNIFTLKNRPLLKYKELDYEIRDSNSVNPYDFIDDLDIYNEVNNYLCGLSLLDSAIIILRLNDFKYFEISKLLEVSTSYIGRVIKRMKDKFAYVMKGL